MKKIFMILAFAFGLAYTVPAQQQEKDKKEEKLQIAIKESAQPDVYIDGTKYPHGVLNLLDNDKIESMNIYKNGAPEQYNAPNGLILITTKENAKTDDELKVIGYKNKGLDNPVMTKDQKVTEKPKIQIRNTSGNKNPLIIVDGVVTDKLDLSKIDTDKIESISVLKDEKALKEYNAPNGVIIITMKK